MGKAERVVPCGSVHVSIVLRVEVVLLCFSGVDGSTQQRLATGFSATLQLTSLRRPFPGRRRRNSCKLAERGARCDCLTMVPQYFRRCFWHFCSFSGEGIYWWDTTCKVAEREFLRRLLAAKQPEMILPVVGLLDIAGKINFLPGVFGEQNAQNRIHERDAV